MFSILKKEEKSEDLKEKRFRKEFKSD